MGDPGLDNLPPLLVRMKLFLLVFSSQLVLSLTGDMISGASAAFMVLPVVTCMI